MKLFKVECAEDGKVYTIRLDGEDRLVFESLSMASLNAELDSFFVEHFIPIQTTASLNSRRSCRYLYLYLHKTRYYLSVRLTNGWIHR
jgi:hypothetical protein